MGVQVVYNSLDCASFDCSGWSSLQDDTRPIPVLGLCWVVGFVQHFKTDYKICTQSVAPLFSGKLPVVAVLWPSIAHRCLDSPF